VKVLKAHSFPALGCARTVGRCRKTILIAST